MTHGLFALHGPRVDCNPDQPSVAVDCLGADCLAIDRVTAIERGSRAVRNLDDRLDQIFNSICALNQTWRALVYAEPCDEARSVALRHR